MALFTSVQKVKDIFLLLVLIVFFSMLLTYHIGLYLPHPPQGHREPQGQGEPQQNLVFKFHQKRTIRKMETEKEIYLQRKESIHRPPASTVIQKLNILDKIFKLEERILLVSRFPAVIQSEGGIDNSTRILEQLLHHLDYSVLYGDKNGPPNIEKLSMIWDLKGHNSSTDTVTDLRKTNNIKRLQRIISEPSYLCNVQKTQNAFSKVKVSDRTICSLPPHSGIKRGQWQHKSETDFVHLHRDGKITIQKQPSADKLTPTPRVLWRVSPGVLMLDGAPFSLRLTALLTSLSPLRAYLHSSCQVFTVNQSGQTLRQDLTSLWHVRQSIQQNFEEEVARGWWDSMMRGLVSALLTAELESWTSGVDNPCSCSRCFQSLVLDVVFTNEFQPVLLKVQRSDFSQMDKDIVDDVVLLTSFKDPVYENVVKAAKKFQPQKMHCRYSAAPCLRDSDLVYILDTRREAMAPVDFLRLYPALSTEYNQLMDYFLHLFYSDRRGARGFTNITSASCHLTAEVHPLLTETERVYLPVSGRRQHVLKRVQDKPIFMSRKLDAEIPDENYKDKDIPPSQGKPFPNCSSEVQDLPLLSEITVTPPSLQLTPEFNPHHTTYRAQTDYNTIVFSVSARTRHCNTTARFHTSDGEESFMTYTLGLGENSVRIHVVMKSNKESKFINTYLILIWRQERGIPQFRPSLRVCHLAQDCELKYLPRESCGLTAVTSFRSWRLYLKHSEQLPVCHQSDYQQASWFVPCEDCKNPNSCHWRSAIWQPEVCQSKHLSDLDISTCFRGRKVLFIGDSTNRGIMHYILEKINGSLMEWDKTHNLKLYKSINGNETDLSFSYYPQFWLPTNHRPAFDKAIYQLIKWTQPLTNDNRTVLVVGGVHWLASQHLDLILKALKRENLSRIKLIIKGLGSGFHQHVNGVHYLPEADLQKLLLREEELERHGRKLGFEFIKTFKMTMARFKDFLQGKCACHFHKLAEVTNTSHSRPVYHVEGEINAVYSQMIINSICRR